MVAPQEMTLSSTLPLVRVNRDTFVINDDLYHCDDQDDFQVMHSFCVIELPLVHQGRPQSSLW